MRGITIGLVVCLVAMLAGYVLLPTEKMRWEHVGPSGAAVRFERDEGSGAVKIESGSEADYLFGLGLVHALDRTTQLFLLRIIGQGRISELLRADEASLSVDSFMRELNFRHEADVGASQLEPKTKALVHSYCEGINHFLAHYPLPLELRLLGLSPEPWTASDVLLITKIMTYVPLAEVQRDVEAFIFRSFQLNVHPGFLKRLYSPFLDGVTDELLALYRQVSGPQGPLPEALQHLKVVPRAKNSNNWVLAPSRSLSGAAIGASDPHLDTARLPAIWYEVQAVVNGLPRTGISVPGMPGLLFGRTKELFWSFTYGFMDTVDLFIEDIKREDGAYYYRRGEKWEPVKQRKETIVRKGQEALEQDVLEAAHCVIETASPLYNAAILPDGLYLCRAWSNGVGGMAESVENLIALPAASDVFAAQDLAMHISLPANHLFIDSLGNIAFQQSGKLPNRKQGWSGLYPLPAWEEENHWEGFASPDKLVRISNPPSGYLATANNHVLEMLPKEERDKYPLSQNLWMGYRIDRIHQLLGQKDKFSPEDFKKMHFDLYSLQAKAFMLFMRPLLAPLPPSLPLSVLLSWDYTYHINSTAAPIFLEIYSKLFDKFYGKIYGEATWDEVKNTGPVVDFFMHYDRLFLSYEPEDPFGVFAPGESKESLLVHVAQEVLASYPTSSLPTWGQVREVKMKNILFDGALPAFLGADHVMQQPGNGATVQQGSLFLHKGRANSFAPSWRAVVDISKDEIETTLPGGPSGNFLSRFYKTGVEGWIKGTYRKISLV